MENTDGVTNVTFIAQDPSTVASLELEAGPASSNPSQEGLPSGVVLEIFQFLDLHSLLKCRLVCSGFQYLIDSTASVQYQIELAVAGQQDGSYGDVFTRREMLKMHQKRWNGLQWTEVLHVPMMLNGWALCGGVFAQASSKPYTLHLKRLPSQSRGIKEKNWILDLSILLGEESEMKEFGMDPGQDLLVVISRVIESPMNDDDFRIHLLTLSKGERHPLTSEPCIVPHDLCLRESPWFSIDIYHDFLRIHAPGGLVLWNWKTGKILMDIVSYREIASIEFLDDRYVLMAILRDTPYLLAVDFLAEPPEERRLDELQNYFIFQFPDFSDPPPLVNNIIDALDITMHSNPRSTWEGDAGPSVPFSMVPQNRLLVICLFTNEIGEDLCFAILEASFLSLIKTGLRINNNRFDWFMWGPEHSRTLPNFSHSFTWPLSSYGTRFAFKRHLPHRGLLIEVYDFNQLGCCNKKQDGDDETPGNVNVSESGVTIERRPVCVLAPARIKGNLFHDQVETRLGYTVTSWSVPGRRFINVMCSEDAIIIVDEEDGMYEIYTV